MQITTPPRIRDIQSDTKWTAICNICWHWSSGNSRKEAGEKLRHHVRCKYISVDEDRIKWLKPKNVE